MTAEASDSPAKAPFAILWRIPRLMGASVLFGLIWFCPFPVGCQEQFWWSQLGAGVLVAGGLFLIGASRHRRGIPSASVVFVLLALAALLAIQLLPLPGGVIELLSPRRASLGADSARALGLDAPSNMALTIASKETRDALLLLLAYTVAFVCGMLIFTRPGRIRRLYATLATSGAVMSAYGFIVFLADGNWGRLRSTYTNPNRLSALLGICMLAGVGWRLLADRAGRKYECNAATGAAAICGLGFVATLSRMGIASMSVSVLLLAFLALRRQESLTHTTDIRSRRLLIVGTSIAMSALLLSLLTSFDPVWQRYSVLFDSELSSNGRLTCWVQSLGISSDFFLFGSGAGSYQHIFPLYQEAGTLSGFWKYAHNDYVNALTDVGPIGLLLVLVGIGLWYRSASRGLGASSNASRVASWVGIGAMTFVALHSAADFVLKQPANAFVLAVVLGATLGAGGTQSRRWSFRHSRWVLISAGISAVLAAMLFIPLTRSAYLTPPDDASATRSVRTSHVLALAADPRGNDLRQAAAREVIDAPPDTSAPAKDRYVKALGILTSAPPGELIDARAVYLAGALMYQLGQPDTADEAVAFAVSVARAYPSITRAGGTYFIRRLIETRGRHESALSRAVDALKVSNLTSMSAGDVRTSLELLERVPGGTAHLREVTPDVEWAIRLLVGQHTKHKRYEEAKMVVENYRDKLDGELSPSMLSLLADLQDRSGDTEAALDSRVSYILRIAADRRTSAAAAMVWKFIRQHRPAEANMLANALKRRFPEELAGLRAEAEFARYSRDYLTASRLLSKVVELSSNPDDFYQAAMLAMKLRRYTKAELYLSRAIRLRPGYATYWSKRATVRERSGEIVLAMQDLRYALDLEPRRDSVRIHLGGLLLKARRIDELVALWRDAVNDRPANAFLHEQLARALFVATDFDLSIVHARKSYELAPKRRSIRDFLQKIDPDGPISQEETR